MKKVFDKWCQASEVTEFGHLRGLIILEEFKNSLPEHIFLYLNKQKVASLVEAAVPADNCVQNGLVSTRAFLCNLCIVTPPC